MPSVSVVCKGLHVITTRHKSTRVFPEPGPAGRYRGPSTCKIAAFCCGFGLNPTSFQRVSSRIAGCRVAFGTDEELAALDRAGFGRAKAVEYRLGFEDGKADSGGKHRLGVDWKAYRDGYSAGLNGEEVAA